MRLSWTLISIISRVGSLIIGIVLSAYVISFLSVYEQGVRGIVVGIVAMLGVMQNLGLSSGSTKEIASATTLKDAGKVFLGALGIRYLLSIPVALILILGSGRFADFYNVDEIIKPLQIFGIVLLVQAMQATLKSLMQGLHKFSFLFTHQVFLEALPSLMLHIYFLNAYGFIGFFYAQLASVLFSTITLGIYSASVMRGEFEVPTMDEFKKIFRSIFKIAIIVYVIKIIITQWEQFGSLVIGKIGSPEDVAVFTVALFIALKVVTISDAVTDVSLPRMSSVYQKSRDKFSLIFMAGNSKAFVLILFGAVSLILLKRELIIIIDFVLAFMDKEPLIERYQSSFRLVDILIIAFWFYSHLNLFKSGFSIPIGKPIQALVVFLELMAVSLVSLLLFRNFMDLNLAIAISMACGGLVAYLHYLGIIKKELGVIAVQQADLNYLIISVVLVMLSYSFPFFNIFIFAVFSLISLYFMKIAFNRNEN